MTRVDSSDVKYDQDALVTNTQTTKSHTPQFNIVQNWITTHTSTKETPKSSDPEARFSKSVEV